jgi:hypothetical protein
MGDESGSAPKAASRDTVIESLVLCFASSSLKEKVPADALRSVLALQYRDLLVDGVLDLGEVWDLLEAQPGFDSDAAGPPLCRFKSMETRLGLTVRLPAHLEKLPWPEREDLAARCRVDSDALDKLDRKAERAGEPRKDPSRKVKKLDPTAAPAVSGPRGAAPIKLLVVALVAFASLGVAGYFLWDAVGGGVKFTQMQADLGDLPAADLRRRGNEALATLTDDGWLSYPEAKRRGHLEKALENLAAAGVEVLVLRDSRGELAATARWRPGTRDLAAWFR